MFRRRCSERRPPARPRYPRCTCTSPSRSTPRVGRAGQPGHHIAGHRDRPLTYCCWPPRNGIDRSQAPTRRTHGLVQRGVLQACRVWVRAFCQRPGWRCAVWNAVLIGCFPAPRPPARSLQGGLRRCTSCTKPSTSCMRRWGGGWRRTAAPANRRVPCAHSRVRRGPRHIPFHACCRHHMQALPYE